MHIYIYIYIHRYTQTPLLEDESSIAKRLKTLESPTREYFCRPHSLYSLPTIPLIQIFLFFPPSCDHDPVMLLNHQAL